MSTVPSPDFVSFSDMISIGQVGHILERLVGRAAFVSIYLAAGVFGGLLMLSSYPVFVSFGPSAAIFGLYGLLAASLLWGYIHRRPAPESDAEIVDDVFGPQLTVPLMVVKRLGPAALLFILYNLSNESTGAAAEFAGMSIVCASVAFQYDEFFSATAISIGLIALPPTIGRKCSIHSSLKRPMLM